MEAAFQRLYRDGFRHVAIDQILGDVGISKTAFYKHFECKEDLLLAALENHRHRMVEDFRQVISRSDDSPADQLRALFDAVENITESDWFRGCVFVNVAIEFPLPHEPAHQLAADSKAAIERVVRELADRAGAANPAALAQELCLIMEGAYVTKHVTGNKATIAIARRLAERAIAAHLATSDSVVER
jgi:AcrR family transcriptional regulator